MSRWITRPAPSDRPYSDEANHICCLNRPHFISVRWNEAILSGSNQPTSGVRRLKTRITRSFDFPMSFRDCLFNYVYGYL